MTSHDARADERLQQLTASGHTPADAALIMLAEAFELRMIYGDNPYSTALRGRVDDLAITQRAKGVGGIAPWSPGGQFDKFERALTRQEQPAG